MWFLKCSTIHSLKKSKWQYLNKQEFEYLYRLIICEKNYWIPQEDFISEMEVWLSALKSVMYYIIVKIQLENSIWTLDWDNHLTKFNIL